MTASDILFDGGADNWTRETARLAMPLLLRCAIDGRTITYSELDEALHAAHGRARMPVLPVYDGAAPAGTKVADAVKVVLAILREASGFGVASADLRAALQAAGVRSGTAETARAVLRSAGLVRCEGRRWYVAEP